MAAPAVVLAATGAVPRGITCVGSTMWRSWSPSESSMSFRAGFYASRPISEGDCATVDRSNQSASG
ncbi:hypothetical protein ACLQ2D_22095 [Streptomyces sp. DT199]|uniref:hypothetical protein n=1 Tax=Streptomyces sp. DT199 TaxID=3393421 RepID=UPI003CEDBA0E